ncbi:DUF1573 domain-containing protein [Hymenobacter sp. IS2118]|uniref:DUF1573 domain-containing protein n=1 Tax=Hymenobacter sp. IS2118 TaxID=1505605 RepID=UPI0009074528|nr:DUF1573 domain-containing protein [Hymenobacter sp. IS2118]
MKKTLLLALGLTAAAYTAQAQAAMPAAKAAGPVAGPAITFEESKFDFGAVAQGAVVDHTFKFKNTGTAPLIISNIGVSCGCTTPEWTKTPVMPGKTGSISAHFNTAGKLGMQNKVLTVESNSPAGSTSVALVGEVKEPSSLPTSDARTADGTTSMTTGSKKVKEKTSDSKFKAKVK